MTGAQEIDSAMPIPELVRTLEAEGVKKTLVLSDEPSKLAGVDTWHRDRLEEAQKLLRDTTGTTVLVYDQHCAADLRRKRRRGQAPEPPERIFINEAVCEGCGDCGVKSNCLSLFPVETELGRKTRVHQASCNKDYSCIDGDCPSFVRVIPGERPPSRSMPALEDVQLPRPELKTKQANIYMVGIGGTGVVTANQLLATAAVLEGKDVVGVDQTGLSQKGGPVVSHLKIVDHARNVSNCVAAGEADVFLGFDVLSSASPEHLAHARPDKTVAVISTSRIPTGRMVTHIDEAFPELDTLAKRIDAHTRFQDNVYLDAVALAEHFFGDHMPANVIILGAAYQQGLLPLEKWSVEKAIELNGVAAEVNRKAFALGRRAAADPEWLGTISSSGSLEPASTMDKMDGEPSRNGPAWELVQSIGANGELQRLTHFRASELIEYQNVDLARRYVDFVRRVVEVERERVGNGTRLSEAVARGLFKLMAYKDEYEVARLHTKSELTEALAREFGPGARWELLLHPPLLRALGMKKKVAFGAWFRPVLRALAKLKFLRGTPFDVFGYAKVRRIERELIDEYRSIIEKELISLTPERYDTARELAELPDAIRGYEDVKIENVERFRKAVRQKLALQA